MKQKVFEAMAKAYPQLEPLRQCRHTQTKMRKVKLAVGSDGRNRTLLWPFQSKTGRTQPKAAKWIYSPAVWIRSLIKPAEGMALASLDYVSMELLIAAALSDGHCGAVNPMLEMYRSGDPYLVCAEGRLGAAGLDAELHGDIRNKYKLMMLSSQYGISPFTLGGRLNVPTFEANILLDEHRTLFSQYWAWSDDYIQHAMQTGVMRTAFGWTYHIGLISDTNVRSLRNWPIQSAGADILRIACILAVRHGIKLLAPIHDAVLIEAPDDRIEADAALMQEIMRRASRIVLNNTADGTHELRTDAKIIRYPNRYFDKRGAEVWNNVLQAAGTAPAPEDGERPCRSDCLTRSPKRDLAEWDAEIEAEFQRAVRQTKAAGRRQRGSSVHWLPGSLHGRGAPQDQRPHGAGIGAAASTGALRVC